MFDWIARKLDRSSCRILLGNTVKKRAWQLQKGNSDLSEQEAEQRAMREALASMRAEVVDITSYLKVREWSERFLNRNS